MPFSARSGQVTKEVALLRARACRASADEPVDQISAFSACSAFGAVLDGTIPFPTPVVLGHEGAGVVEEVGRGVTSVAAGDHVVLTTLGNCGQCDACDRRLPTRCRHSVGGGMGPGRFTVGGRDAFQFANAGVFSQQTVVWETQCVGVDFYKSGRFLLDEMVTQVYDLAEIGQALSDLEGGKLNQAVLDVAG